MPPRGLLAALIATVALASSARAGGISYPALGNIRLGQGTIEVWFTPTAKELNPKVDSWTKIFSLYHFDPLGPFKMGCYWEAKPNRYGFHISSSNPSFGGTVTPEPAWETGTPHHYAFTWDGTVMKMILDGKVYREQDEVIPMLGRLYGTRLILGGDDFEPTPVIIHAVRTSTLARTPEQLAEARPRADRYTLLLDRFESQGGEEGRTSPVVHAGLTGESGGQIKQGHHYTQEPKPGIALYPAEQ